MEPCILVSGCRGSDMVKENNIGLMDHSMRVIGKSIMLTVKED